MLRRFLVGLLPASTVASATWMSAAADAVIHKKECCSDCGATKEPQELWIHLDGPRVLNLCDPCLCAREDGFVRSKA